MNARYCPFGGHPRGHVGEIGARFAVKPPTRPDPCRLPQSPESSLESAAMNADRAFVPTVEVARRARRARLPGTWCTQCPWYRSRREHAVRDEIHARAVFADPRRSRSAHPRCRPRQRREIFQIARQFPGLFGDFALVQVGLGCPFADAGRCSDSGVRGAVSVKNTLDPSLVAA